MIQIDKGIPIPEKTSTARRDRVNDQREPLYPARQMEEGDSFLVPWKDQDRRTLTISVMGSCRRQRPGAKFTSRVTPQGLRIWLIEKEPS